MVDFTKLVQKRGGEPLVTNNNVVGDSDLFKNFDQKISQINLGDFDSNIRRENIIDNQSKISENPQNYIVAIDKADISQTNSAIEISMDYMHQNEQFIQYQQRIKQLLRDTDCKNIGELLSKHGDSKKVIDAMSTLQKTFNTDPKLKQHYQSTMTNFKNLNNKFNDMRDHIHRGSTTGIAAVQNIAANEYNGNVGSAVQSYKADMTELNDMRNEAIHNINETMIPFVDDHGKHVVSDLEDDLKNDQESVKAVAEIDVNKPETQPEITVESAQLPPDNVQIAQERLEQAKRQNNYSGPSL